MNIFYLSDDPEQAAKWHCDKHINKMVIEYAQILSTAAWKNDFHDPDRMYKPVPNINPKVHNWAAKTGDNMIWLLKLAREVADEFEYRYGHTHASYEKVISNFDMTEIRAPDTGFEEPPLCMGNSYKVEGDAIKSYRRFYIHGKDWSMSWFKRDKPPWYSEAGEVREFQFE